MAASAGLCHGFVPTDRPAPPPVATTMTRTTALGLKSEEGAAGRRRHKSEIINDGWIAGDDKEGSRQEQTTTNHCVLKAMFKFPGCT